MICHCDISLIKQCLFKGIFGIFFEGQGLIFLSFNPLMWLYAFIVHGSYLAMAHIIIKKEPILQNNKKIPILKKYIYSILFSILTFIPFVFWEKIINSFS